MGFLDREFLTFVFFILLLFYLLPSHWRRGLLILSSFLFYASYSLIHAQYMVLFGILSYVIYRWVIYRGQWLAGYLLVVLLFGSFIVANKLGYLRGVLPSQEGEALQYFITLYPIGISFHFLQVLSLCIDLKRSERRQVLSVGEFFLMVFFFPKVLAGPLERQQDFRSGLEFSRHPSLNSFGRSLELFILGAGLKILVANSLSPFINPVFSQPKGYSSLTLGFGLLFFRIQLYADFFGYFLMSYGLARMFGLKLSVNFLRPYCSVGLTDHWRRWNTTLGGWFRDYIMFPLSHHMTTKTRVALLTTFVFLGVGIWHGLDSKYLIWGFLNGLWVSIEGNFFRRFIHRLKLHPFLRVPASLLTLGLISLLSVFIRADSTAEALSYLQAFLHNGTKGQYQTFEGLGLAFFIYALFELMNWINEYRQTPLRWHWSWRWGVSLTILYLIHAFGNSTQKGFIYFQF